MINEFLEQICKEPDKQTLHKAKLAIIDWIGYSIAGTFTKQADPFKNLQFEFPKGNCLNLFESTNSYHKLSATSHFLNFLSSTLLTLL